MTRVKVLLAIVEIAFYVVLIMFAIFDLLPRFTPAPALVYSHTAEQIPGATTLKTTFDNNAQAPLYDLKAAWTVNDMNVRLTYDPDAPAATVIDRQGNHELAMHDPFPAQGSFAAYLHADTPFALAGFHASANLLLSTRHGYERMLVDTLSAAEWQKAERRSDIHMVGVVALMIALVFALSFLFRITRSKV